MVGTEEREPRLISVQRERESKIHRLAVPVLKSIQNLVISHRCCAAVVLKGVMRMQNCWFVNKPYCILDVPVAVVVS